MINFLEIQSRKMKTPFIMTTAFTLLLVACGGGEETESTNSTDQTVETDVDTTSEAMPPEDEGEVYEYELSDCKGLLDVYLNDPDESGTNVRNSPGGDVVTKLVKDEEDNLEFFIQIVEQEDGWFKVKQISNMSDGIEIPGGEGWIHGSVLAVDTRNYGGETLYLLESPEEESAVNATIEGETYGLQLINFCGDWAEVSFEGVQGWIQTEWLCGNPLSTCS